MIDERDILERELRRFEPEPGLAQRVYRRRDRKRQKQRIAAGAVGVIVALVTAAVLARVIESDHVPVTPPKPLGAIEVLSAGDSVVARDPDTGELRTIVDAESLPPAAGEYITSAEWSADRQWVAFRRGSGSGAGSLWVADVNGGAPRKVATAWGYSRWAWSPIRDELVAVRGRDVILIDAATGRQTDLVTATGALDSEGEAVHTLAWSSDASRIAYDGKGGVYSIDVESGEQSLLVRQPAGLDRPIDIDWSPDGAHVAISYYSSTWRRQSLYLANADGSHLRLLVDNPEVGTAWSPDGGHLAYTKLSGPDAGYELWTVPMDGSVPSLVASGCCVSGGVGAVWSPEGSQIALETEHEAGSLGHLVVNADGTGDMGEISPLTYSSWDGGGYFCGCYG
jgi:hypothetical protein